MIAQWRELQAQGAAETAARSQQIQALEASLREARARVRELCEELETLYHHGMVESLRSDMAQNRLHAELAASCPVAVQTFLEKISAEIEHWQRAHHMSPSVGRRLEALQRAREQAEALQRAPLTSATILTGLQSIERSLPEVPGDHQAREFATVH